MVPIGQAARSVRNIRSASRPIATIGPLWQTEWSASPRSAVHRISPRWLPAFPRRLQSDNGTARRSA